MDKIEEEVKFYIIYKTINLINNKIYIGMHETYDLNDGYMGSGKAIELAFRKYGKKNFNREILFFCKTREEMRQKERELVTEEFINRENTYNLTLGGYGGFYYVNKSMTKEQWARNGSRASKSEFWKSSMKKLSQERRRIYEIAPKYCKHCNKILSWDMRNNLYCSKACRKASARKNFHHSDVTKEKISAKLKKNFFYCEHCGENIDHTGYCKLHQGKLQRLFDTNEKKIELFRRVQKEGKSFVAKQYNVSWEALDNFLRKNKD